MNKTRYHSEVNVDNEILKIEKYLKNGNIENTIVASSEMVIKFGRDVLISRLEGILSPSGVSCLLFLCENTPTKQQKILSHGQLYFDKGFVQEAERMFEESLTLEKTPFSLSKLAKTKLVLGKAQEAIELYEAALSMQNNNVDLNVDYVDALVLKKENKKAKQHLQNIIHSGGQHYKIWFALGVVLRNQNDFSNSIFAFSRAIELNPNHDESYNNRAIARRSMGLHHKALDDFNQLIRINPKHVPGLLNRAALLADLEQYAAALADFEKVLILAPGNENGFLGIAAVYHRMGKNLDAISWIENAILLRNDLPNAYLTKGNILHELGLLDEAITSFEKAFTLEPSNYKYRINLANILQEKSLHKEAIDELKNIASKDKSLVHQTNYNKANSMLLQNMNKSAWQSYESRHELSRISSLDMNSKPLLRDISPKGQKVLCQWDQRFGDIIQVLRYVPILKEQALSCSWQIAPELMKLVASSFPTANLKDVSDFSGDYDFRLPITSLPFAMRTFSKNDIPCKCAYLTASESSNKAATGILKEIKRPILGFVWRGRRKPVGRSMNILDLEKLFYLSNFQMVSLQLDPTSEERKILEKFNILDLSGYIKNFDDTAAFLEKLTRLVTIDTSVAHLSGAVGTETLIAIKKSGDWRWISEGTRSLWYPSVKVFRQKKFLDWSAVIDEMVRELENVYS